MDRYSVVLVLSSLVISNVDGRSWGNHFPDRSSYGDRIVFEGDARRWQNSGESSEEWVHDSGSHEPSYKQLRNWDPDKVWFPDFGEGHSSVITSSTEAIEVATPPISRNVDECINQCPTTSEYNPVCGTNKVTYSNIGRLECARMCGVDVRVFRQLPCSLVSQETSTTEGSQSLDEQRQCIQTCPSTPVYNPICGTNNVTYQNRGRLECARFCGIDVEVKRLSPCPTVVSSASSATDDFSNSDQAQWPSTSTFFTASTVAPDNPNVSIPQEILDEIFTKPIEDSNEVDIDIRKGDKRF